jgi:hypothetical protein
MRLVSIFVGSLTLSLGSLALAQPALTEPATVAPAPVATQQAAAATGFDLAGWSTGNQVMDGETATATELSAAAWYEASASWHYRKGLSSRADSRGAAALRLSSGEPGVSLEHQLFVRPYEFEVFQLELGNQLGVELRPALSQRPDLWRRRYSREAFQVGLVGVQYLGARVGAQLMIIEEGFAWEWQHDAADGASGRRFSTTSDWSPLAITHRKDGALDGKFDLIALEAIAIDAARDGVVMETLFARFTDVPVGPLPLHFDAAYGRGATGWSQISVDGEVVSDIGSEDLPVIDAPVGRLRLRTAIGGVEAEVAAERHLYLTFDTALALEERATARLSLPAWRGQLTGTGFAAHTELWSSPVDSEDFVTGGGSLALAYPLPDAWQLAASAEVAQSFYATIDADRALHAELAARIDVTLRRELRSWAAAR